MRKRPLILVMAVSMVAAVSVVGWTAYRASEVRQLVSDAEARLEAPLAEVPELDRIQASTAASLLDRATALGAVDDRVTGMRHHAQALEHLQKGDLVFAEGELLAARQLLGWTSDLRVLAGALARRLTREDEARQHVEEALESDPNHARALMLRADLALDRGDAAAARMDLEALLETAGDSSVVHNRLGLALEELGDSEGAERELKEAIRLSERNHDAWINLGRLMYRQARLDEALDAFEEAVARAGSDPDARLGRGLVLADLGDADRARLDYQRAAELAPNDAEPLLALGDLQRDSSQLEAAIDTYRRALAREDADAASWLKLGNALVLGGDARAGSEAFRQALRRAPELAPALNGLGAALMELGQLDDATLSLRRAAELDRRDPNPLYNLALTLERAGDRDGARVAWESALERAPGSTVALRHLGRLGG